MRKGAGGYLDVASLAFGILSVFMWPIHPAGFLTSIVGLALGIVELRHGRRGLALPGVVLAGIGLVLVIVDWKIGLLDLILKTYFQY